MNFIYNIFNTLTNNNTKNKKTVFDFSKPSAYKNINSSVTSSS